MQHATLWGKHGRTLITPPEVLTTLPWYRNPDTRTAEEAVAWVLRQLRKGSGAAYLQIVRDLDTLYNSTATPCLCPPPHCEITTDELVRVYLRNPIRGPGTPGGILAPGTALSFTEYQDAFYATLEAISQFVLRHPLNSIVEFAPQRSRENSGRFEREWLKPLVRREQHKLVRSVNRQLCRLNIVNGSRLRLVSVLSDDPEGEAADSESSKRSPYDLWCTLVVTHQTGVRERLEAPVNVKYVQPDTSYVNTGGAGMMAWALMGVRDRDNRVHVFDTLKEKWERRESLVDSDYFFLAFSKGSTTRTTDSAWVSSLLGVDPYAEAFAYAANQSFPRLQIHCRRAEDCIDKLPTANQARLRLMNWWGPMDRNEADKRLTKSREVEQVLFNYVTSSL